MDTKILLWIIVISTFTYKMTRFPYSFIGNCRNLTLKYITNAGYMNNWQVFRHHVTIIGFSEMESVMKLLWFDEWMLLTFITRYYRHQSSLKTQYIDFYSSNNLLWKVNNLNTSVFSIINNHAYLFNIRFHPNYSYYRQYRYA